MRCASFILSLVETYLTLKKDADGTQIEELLNIGKSILDSPTRIFEGVENTLEQLSQNYKLFFNHKRRACRSGTQNIKFTACKLF